MQFDVSWGFDQESLKREEKEKRRKWKLLRGRKHEGKVKEIGDCRLLKGLDNIYEDTASIWSKIYLRNCYASEEFGRHN